MTVCRHARLLPVQLAIRSGGNAPMLRENPRKIETVAEAGTRRDLVNAGI